jgi:SAM-dependent methyltransferase
MMEAGEQLEAARQRARATWAAGDFHKIAQRIWEVGGRIVDRVSPQAGEDLLDVGCGTGNVTVRAAQTGARTVGLDITPELLEVARRVATDVGVEVEWVEGDAEALPFDDASFDVVASTFGCMFAPRHHVAAAEIGRVLRPGGRIAIAAWTPEGKVGDFFRAIAAHVPPPPADFEPPPLWGVPDHVREIFDGTEIELSFSTELAEMRFDSLDEVVAEYENEFGPIVVARATLEPEGKFDALRDDLREMFDRTNEADDGTVLWRPAYLVIGGRKSG